jgi:transposase
MVLAVVRVWRMRSGISFTVSADERQRLGAIVADPKSPQKHVWRARIVLLSGEGLGTLAIMAETGKSKTCVWRWQERFMHEGVDGLLRDKTRPPGKAPVPPDRVAWIVRQTQEPPPHEATHWTLRAMAKAAGVAASTVQGIWKAHGLTPHRWRHFKLSNDPAFAEKLTDIVGLYVDPPAHAVVLSIDEKSQIQALERTQPGLPMKKGRAGTMTHDYKRHGTTTLFAALNVLDGTVIGQNMQRHRHQEFIRFLNRVAREMPADRDIHVILDNYAAHKKDKVCAWFARHPRWTFHFTPTSCSWLNAVEGFFAKLTRRRLKHGVFHSVADLQAAINRFVQEHNADDPKPFVWNADPDAIIAARNRGFQTLESIH